MFDFNWALLVGKFGVIIFQIIVIFIAYMIANAIGKKLIYRYFQKTRQNGKVSEGRAAILEKLMYSLLSYTLGFIVVVVVFGIFGLPIGGLIAGAGVLGLAVGFGAQGLVSDVVTGFFILLEKWVDVGDVVTIAGLLGIVEEVGLKTTQIRGFDGTLHFIPNRNITTISNMSRGNMRAMVDIRISYEDNIDKAIAVLEEVCAQFVKEDSDGVFTDPPSVLGVQSLGTSEVTIRVVGKTQNGMQYGVQRRLQKMIKEAFDKNDIVIPYPHQVNVDGGEQKKS